MQTPEPAVLGEKNVAIRASAGSGKTFALARRFLRLLLQGVAPQEILATTFTRKAAGEILARLVGRLCDAVLDPSAATTLYRDLDIPPLPPEQLRKYFDRLSRQLAGWQVSTLDRLFVGWAQERAWDLGLPMGWRIADPVEENAIRRQTLFRLLASGDRSALVQLTRMLSKGDVERSIFAQMDELTGSLEEMLADALPSAWEAVIPAVERTPAEIESALDVLAATEFSDGRLRKGRDADLNNARLQNWEELISKGIAGKVALGEETYYGKTLPAELLRAYRVLIDHAAAVLRNRLVTQNHATRDLLACYGEEWGRSQYESGIVRFSDVTRRLANAPDPRPTDQTDIGQVRHLLIDEFQDTSAAQWRAIAALAKSCSESPGSFFVVGDPKQAIYGWRGGAAEILDDLEHEIPNLAWEDRALSYRSSPVVLDVVNRVFGSLEANPLVEGTDDLREAASHWAQSFPEHRAAKSDLPGHVEIRVAEEDETDEDRQDAVFAMTARRIAEQHQRAPTRTIGVLVRDNNAVAAMLVELRRQGVSASEEGGIPLSRYPAVSVLLSFMHWLDHPGSSADVYHVRTSPIGERLGLAAVPDAPADRRTAHDWRTRLFADGFAVTIARMVDRVVAGLSTAEAERLDRLVERAIRFEPRFSGRLIDFVRDIEATRVEDPRSSAVRVMTIHQAKGLEFDAVFLPQLDKQIKGQPPHLVAGRSSPTGPINAACRYVQKNEQAQLPAEVQELFRRHWQSNYRESLNLLYVAMTRAIHSLCITIGPAKKNEKNLPATFAGLLRGALTASAPLESGAILFESGDAGWSERLAATRSELPRESCFLRRDPDWTEPTTAG